MPFAFSVLPTAERLKQATHEQHQKSEALLGPRLASIASYEDYAAILRMFYGYFEPLSHRIASLVTPAQLPDIAERRTAARILHDLAAIGFPANDPELCDELPALQSIPQAVGALYVLEGSTLGGRMITKMLQKNPHVSLTPESLGFFEGYGAETGNKWRGFQSLVNQFEGSDADALIESANQTFQCFGNWIYKNLYHE